MAELKTRPNEASVESFLDSVADDGKRADARALLDLMREVTGEEPVMWGGTIVGFGTYRYRYDSGREGDWFLTGFSPRKQNLTLYVMAGFDRYDQLMARLGKHRTGKSCLYLNRLSDVDTGVLRELVGRSVAHMKSTYPAS
jgi:hypothetical protein